MDERTMSEQPTTERPPFSPGEFVVMYGSPDRTFMVVKIEPDRHGWDVLVHECSDSRIRLNGWVGYEHLALAP